VNTWHAPEAQRNRRGESRRVAPGNQCPRSPTGRIVGIDARLGDEVKQGQILFKVRTPRTSRAPILIIGKAVKRDERACGQERRISEDTARPRQSFFRRWSNPLRAPSKLRRTAKLPRHKPALGEFESRCGNHSGASQAPWVPIPETNRRASLKVVAPSIGNHTGSTNHEPNPAFRRLTPPNAFQRFPTCLERLDHLRRV